MSREFSWTRLSPAELTCRRCSGDGTMRKNLEIWGKWLCHDGNSLHS